MVKNTVIKVRFFASIREKVGKSIIEINLDQPISLSQLFSLLADYHQEFEHLSKKVLKKISIPYLLILNGSQITDLTNTQIPPGSELAILPPVSGG